MRFFGLLISLLVVLDCAAAQVDIENVRLWPAPKHTRVVFDVGAPVPHSLFVLEKPSRIVIDLRNARLRRAIPVAASEDSFLAGIRSASRNRGDLRVVLDLKQAARAKSFLLKPNAKYGHRLVIDLQVPVSAKQPKQPVRQITATKLKPKAKVKLRDLVIAIDAGHGGEDPGALGARGSKEKIVVMQIARQLEKLIRRERGLRAVMVRRGDYYVGLRERMRIARREKADLFVSIHADAFKDSRVRGSSVYVLSHNGASSEAAKWLADQENSADLIGGVSLDDKDDLLASVLLDLSQTATLSASTDAAGDILKQLKGLGKTHKRRVQRAGFMVLKSPDIPSILIETAFISNPAEERKLLSPRHQRSLAAAILKGVRAHLERTAPPDSLLAARKHVIARGDTLSKIANHYRVSMDALRTANALPHDKLFTGQILRIPPTHGS